MITCEEINRFFTRYRENLKENFKWDDRIFSSTTKEEWLKTMQARAFAMHVIYEENKELMEQTLVPIFADPSILTDEQFDLMLTWLKKLYYSEYDEPFLLRSITNALIPHYEKIDATENLIFLYTCAGLANFKISRTVDKQAGLDSVAYYKKVISYKDEIDTFSNPLSRDYIFVAYANLICNEPVMGSMSLEDAYSIWQELYSIRSRKKFCQYDKTNPRIPALVNLTIDSFYTIGSTLDFEHLCGNSPIRPILDELTVERFHSLMAEHESIYKCNHDIVIYYYSLRARHNEITYDDAWKLMDDFYLYHLKHLHSELDANLISFHFCLPITLIDILNQTTLPEDLKQLKRKFYIGESCNFLKSYPTGFSSYDLNYAVQRFAFHPLILNSFETQPEKEHFLFQIILSRHLNTFTHSVMVETLAETILSYIFVYEPELLITSSIHISCREDLLKYKNEILDYIKRAALLHDIGKNALTDIINTQHRKISDAEFTIIKEHTNQGAAYLSRTKDFEMYQAVALGHHRSYDGSSGYPQDFDNRHSPYAPAIDLIRICDCLDAATDTLSRYYHHPKSFDEIMQEFYDGRGTQYHPEMIDLILAHPDLYEALRHLTGEGRQDIYYQIYQQFIHK